MKDRNKTAIVLGATGLVGGILLDMLLKDVRYDKVVVFSRRALEKSHYKLKVHIGNLLELEFFGEQFEGDEVYCCVGSTQAKTPELDSYKKIDFGIPVATANLCVQKSIHTLIVVSAMGANPKSRFFYNRIKGEMEDTVLRFKIAKIHIVQPALIGGNRQEKRPAESFFKGVMGALDVLMVGPLQKYRMIDAEHIAKAMLWLANHPFEKERIPSDTLRKLGSYAAS
ncbi:MAG: NAD-dependent epimerase/dehydratase family protein [Bacteroidota bacterium]